LLSRFCYVFLDEIHSGLSLINDAINNSIVKYRHLIPKLDDIFNELYESCMSSKNDLKFSYYQIKMKERGEGKNNFKTKHGLFKWLVMLFSHTIIHSNLMILMNHILCAFIGSFVVDYFDDIYSKNLGENIEYLCFF
jgi:hypothetical protein